MKIINSKNGLNFNGNISSIEKRIFNYAMSGESIKIEPYTGLKNIHAGFSTEAPGLGGGWLKASCETPLSTSGVHTCAVLNLVDESNDLHVLYHVMDRTGCGKIIQFIEEKFPFFTKANIVGGEQLPTINTMKRIINALNKTRPDVKKDFYYTVTETPELVAYQGKMFYMKESCGQLSFEKNKLNYWY